MQDDPFNGPYDPETDEEKMMRPEKAAKKGRQNRISGFNHGMDVLIGMATAMCALDTGTSGTEETHDGGYAEAASRSLDALRKIKAVGIKD